MEFLISWPKSKCRHEKPQSPFFPIICPSGVLPEPVGPKSRRALGRVSSFGCILSIIIKAN